MSTRPGSTWAAIDDRFDGDPAADDVDPPDPDEDPPELDPCVPNGELPRPKPGKDPPSPDDPDPDDPGVIGDTAEVGSVPDGCHTA